MFKKQVDDNVDQLDLMIGRTIVELDDEHMSEEQYEKTLKKVEKLMEIRADMVKSKGTDSKFSLIFSGAVQLTGILLILHYEKADVITSKAFNMATQYFKER